MIGADGVARPGPAGGGDRERDLESGGERRENGCASGQAAAATTASTASP